MPKLLVTHHAPDLDAITSVWLFKRFQAQDFADAKVAFVSAGKTISDYDREQLGIAAADVVHVDTGLGEFDHHQKEEAKNHSSASSLVLAAVQRVHPELKKDVALQYVVDFVTDIDHFQELFWPDTENERYNFMIHELIHGLEGLEYHDDDSQLHFGMTCLDSAYHNVREQLHAKAIIQERKQEFSITEGLAMAIETDTDEVIKLAQKMGYVLVIRKDPDEGHIRIKARPDADIDLKPLHDKIVTIDPEADWFYHQSGKMLLNSSQKSQQAPSHLSLQKVIDLTKELYG